MNADPPHAPRRHPLIAGLLGISLILNLAALCLPFVKLDAAGSREVIYGLFGSVRLLLDSGMIGLAVLVVGFSIVFPFAKLGALGWLWWNGVHTPRRVAWLGWVEKTGKWSFFDVFLVAIMVALTSNQWLISSESLPGLTCFMIALIAGMSAGELLTSTTPMAVPAAGTVPPPPSAVLLPLVLAIGVLLAAALLVPFIQIDDRLLVDRSYSLVALLPALWRDSSTLALGLGAFLITTPILNWLITMVMIIRWWRRTPPLAFIRVQHLLNRWSMLPVFALSLAVFFAEGHHFLDTEPRAGIWMLVGGLVLAAIGQLLVARTWRLH